MSWSTIPTEIRRRLLLVPELVDRIGERVHYQQLPESSAYPHVWFQKTSGQNDDQMDGDGTGEDRFVLEIVGENFDSVLVDSVVETLKAFDGPVGLGTVFLTFIEDADDDYIFQSADSDSLFMHALRVTVYHDNEF